MDPTANLEEALEIASSLVEEDVDSQSASETAGTAEQGIRLAELVLALDEWVRKGGFLPRPWQGDARPMTVNVSTGAAKDFVSWLNTAGLIVVGTRPCEGGRVELDVVQMPQQVSGE